MKSSYQLLGKAEGTKAQRQKEREARQSPEPRTQKKQLSVISCQLSGNRSKVQKARDKEQLSVTSWQGAGGKSFISANSNIWLFSTIFFVFLFTVAIFPIFPKMAQAEDNDNFCGSKCHLKPKIIAKNNGMTDCGHCHTAATHNKSADITISQKVSAEQNFDNMIYIPEGEFIMGTDDRLQDEKPAHVVYVESFFIDKFEVTNEDYNKFIEHTGYPFPDNWTEGTYPKEKSKHPVTYVSWHDAKNYCKWAGKRLPKEMEWEKAARGTDGRVYPWGNKWDPFKSNNPIREINDTQPVGTYNKGKSPYGLYDMSGNVWEWVDEYYYTHPGSDYVSPEFGTRYRLLKGGSFWDCSAYGCGISAPTYNRAFFVPSAKGKTYGFRCAKDKKGNYSGR